MPDRATILICDTQAHIVAHDTSRPGRRDPSRHAFAIEAAILPREAGELRPIAAAIARECRVRFPAGLAADLIIPSTWCFVRKVDLPEQKWTSQAAEFALEEYLPVDLEELHCASRPLGAGRGLVAAVYAEPLRELLDELASGGVEVESVTPDVECLFEARTSELAPAGAIRDTGRLVLRTPSTSSGPGVVRTMLLAPQTAGGEEPGYASMLGFGADAIGGVFDLGASRAGSGDGSHSPADVDRLLDRVSTRGDVLNLRCGALAFSGRFARLFRRLQTALAAFVMLLAVWAVDLHSRAQEFRTATADLRPLMSEMYGNVFPGAALQPGAALRVRSERIKLEGLTGSVEVDPAGGPSNLVSFELLHAVTAGIPAAMKLNLSEVIIDEDGIRLAGQTTSHEAAGELVRSLNEAAGVRADPPRTKLRPDKTVDFRIAARKAVGNAPQ